MAARIPVCHVGAHRTAPETAAGRSVRHGRPGGRGRMRGRMRKHCEPRWPLGAPPVGGARPFEARSPCRCRCPRACRLRTSSPTGSAARCSCPPAIGPGAGQPLRGADSEPRTDPPDPPDPPDTSGPSGPSRPPRRAARGPWAVPPHDVGAGGRGSPPTGSARSSPLGAVRSEQSAQNCSRQPTLQGRLVALSPPAPEATYPNVALWPGFNEPFQSALWTITA